MLDLCKDEYNISTYYPMDTSARHMPLWVSIESPIQQSSTILSQNLSLKMGNPSPCGHIAKEMDFIVQDQDSSSTQSTDQSYNEVGPVRDQTPKHEVFQLKSISSIGNQECAIPSQVNFGQTYACVPFPCTDPCYGRLFSQTMHIQHPQLMGIGPARVPLPLDLLQNEPIYVNAKQYHAILRRRQYRAKLEAQNKLSKGRKPYLHESRHLHALKRARGSGGRFINTKSSQSSNAAMTTKDNFTPTQIRGVSDLPKSEFYHSKDFESAFSATSSSDIMSASNSSNIYQHQEIRFSLYPSSVGNFYGENQRYLAVNQ